jgi:hypothetical protein
VALPLQPSSAQSLTDLNAKISLGEKALPSAKDTGDLIIEDHFLWSSAAELPHGLIVQTSAQQEGFKGEIYERTPSLVGTQADQARYDRDDATMHAAGTSPGQFLASLRDSSVSKETTSLRGRAQELQALATGGLHDGAVNLSSGLSKESMVDDLYQSAMAVPDQATSDELQQQANLVGNYASAFGFSAAVLRDDSQAGADARGRLEQGLIDQVSQAVDGSDEIRTARSSYDQAVNKLVQKNVSVVVAGENGGWQMQGFTADAGGKAPSLPADYYLNPLSNAGTVTVGAVTGVNTSQEQIAIFNSPVKDDVLGDGVVQLAPGGPLETGTSFAAPRVAAALARMHGQHPGMADADALGELKKNLTHPLPGDPGQLVLDPAKTVQSMELAQ